MTVGSWQRWRSGGCPQGCRLLRGMALIFLPLPPSIHALAWMAAVQGLNTLLASLGMPEIRLMGWAATLWVQFMALLPLAVGICLVGLHTLDPDALEAGEMLAPGLQVLGQVILPLAAPMLAAGTGFLFLLTLVDHSVPGLFGVNTYALDIYAEFSASSQPGRALLLALPCLVMGLSSWQGCRRHPPGDAAGGMGAQASPANEAAAWLEILVNLGLGMVTLQVVVPFLTLAGSTGGAVAPVGVHLGGAQ
jgi:iron(III) transport system permease protein